ncbi:carbohydrate ABC transporter permease [Atribacter laminatus]|uniref:Inner membrane ABC transporter permease protein YcjP n=1 Tax=Atribacter laminatus TaxID=2847778 RepID=A0A7T1F2V9_ATRLM|nr:carbohydrate ABC transporter permease [Atribacter laminatus]QPM68162.1 Inner membrane ABC transporter permease protein YcjP [Atribacter laminatus]
MRRLYSGKKKKRIVNFLLNIILAIILAWVVFPYFWAVSSALRPISKLFTLIPEWLPSPLTLENYKWAFTDKNFLITLKNSIIIGILTALFSLVLSSLSGYSLARFKFKGKKTIVTSLIVSQMVPGVLLIIPIFVIFSQLHLVNTYLGLMLAYSTFSIPFCVLLLRSFFAQFPEELEEAAMVDGCSRLGSFVRITLPLSFPGIMAVTLFCFILAWNDFLFALVLTRDTTVMPVALQLYNISTVQFAAGNWGGILAQGTIITLPVAILFVLLQQYLIQGMTSGAIKG